jgi:AraC-like DNA-binding protein
MTKRTIHLAPGADAALKHFATLLKNKRVERRVSIAELSDRTGASRPTLTRMFEGEPTVNIGLYFEAAWILGLPLFDPDKNRFKREQSHAVEVSKLLPKRVVKKKRPLNDDF